MSTRSAFVTDVNAYVRSGHFQPSTEHASSSALFPSLVYWITGVPSAANWCRICCVNPRLRRRVNFITPAAQPLINASPELKARRHRAPLTEGHGTYCLIYPSTCIARLQRVSKNNTLGFCEIWS